MLFYIRVVKSVPRTVKNYKKEVLRLLAEVTLGSGSLAVIGGTIGVIAAMCFFTGTSVGIQGYAALDQLGTAALTGFISAYFNTREIAPLVAGIALAATVGCGFTAQLGAMRISEEVDALETMAIPSMPFLVTTRVIAGLIAVVPLYIVGLLASYFATRLVVTQINGQSAGTYDHYFNTFLPPSDVLWSFAKVLIFAIVVILIHCYYGYYASGGPAGVGVAVGLAVRTSIVAINVVDLLASMAIWGTNVTVRLAG
nr:ABC transporter permease [Aeromicrobium fastidiosum]